MLARVSHAICAAAFSCLALSCAPALAFAQDEAASDPFLEASVATEVSQHNSAEDSQLSAPDSDDSIYSTEHADDQPKSSAEPVSRYDGSAVLETSASRPDLTVHYTVNFDVSAVSTDYLDTNSRAGTITTSFTDKNATWADGSKGVKSLTGSMTITQGTRVFEGAGIPETTFSADDVSSADYTLRQWVMASWSCDELASSVAGSGNMYYSDTTLFFEPDSSMENPNSFIGSSTNLFIYPRSESAAQYTWEFYKASSSYGGEPQPSDLLSWLDAASANHDPIGVSWESAGGSHPFDQYEVLHLVLNLVPEWCPALTFDSNGGSGELLNQYGKTMSAEQLQINTAMKIVAPQASLQRSGMVQTGWNTLASGNGTHYDALAKVDPIASNMTLYAEWQPASASNLYSITYQTGYSDGGSLPSASGISSDGTTATIQPNDLTRDGYFSNGWNTANDGTGDHFDPGEVITLTSNLVLFPQWSKSSFDVYFRSNGGTGSMGKMSFDYNVAKALDANQFSRSGYDFVGWALTSSATKARYADKQVVKNIAESSGVLYAVWRPNSGINIAFDLDGGSGTYTDLADLNSSAGGLVPSSVPTKDGQVFEGWFFDSASSGTSVRATSATTAGEIAGLGTDTSLKLVAHWSSVPFSIIYDINGATGGVIVPALALGGSGKRAVAPNTLTRSGGVAAGWNTAADGSGTAYSGGEILELTSDLTLYAQFTDSNGALLAAASSDAAASAYSISYDLNGGSGSLTDSGAVASDGVTTVLASNTLSRSGFVANGWNTAADGSGTAYADSASAILDGNMVLYAAWTAIEDSGDNAETPGKGAETPEEGSATPSGKTPQSQEQNAEKSDSGASKENSQVDVDVVDNTVSAEAKAESSIENVLASARSQGFGWATGSGMADIFAGIRSFMDSLGAQPAYAATTEPVVKSSTLENARADVSEGSPSRNTSGFGFGLLLFAGIALIALAAAALFIMFGRRRSE